MRKIIAQLLVLSVIVWQGALDDDDMTYRVVVRNHLMGDGSMVNEVVAEQSQGLDAMGNESWTPAGYGAAKEALQEAVLELYSKRPLR